jgi:hypothetical protein
MPRLLPLLWLALALPAPAAAQGVKRCTDAQGNTVFTDRACASVDAVPKGQPAPAQGAYAEGFAPRGCARSAEDLLVGVRTALEARDVNRLASYYHWAGTGSGSARGVMDELEAIANRPLVAVALAYPAGPAPFDPLLAFGPDAAPEEDPAIAADPGAAPAAETETETETGSYVDPVQAVDPAAARAPAGPRPIALDVQQMAGDRDAGSRSTRFQLHRHVGCWWLAL